MFPPDGFFETIGLSAGDWPVRLVDVNAFRAGGPKVIEAFADPRGKPFIARIVGRDPTYRWRRDFMPTLRVSPSDRATSSVVWMRVGVAAVGKLPAALEIRWGPATGPLARGAMMAAEAGTVIRLCAFRAFFVLSLDGLKQVQDVHVAMLIDEGLVSGGPGPARRPPGSRARIDFGEEV